MFPHGERVTRLRAGVKVDPYSGESVPDWTSETEAPFAFAAVWPAGSTEPLSADRQAVEADYEVALPAGSDVTRVDRIRLDDRPGAPVCEVVGVPFDFRSPLTGWRPGLVVSVKHVGG